MSGNLIMMCGIPGSGKSHVARQIKSEHTKYVSRDEIRFSILKPNQSYFSQETKVFKKFCDTVDEYLGQGFDVIADATFLNKNSRMKFLAKIANKPNRLIAKVMSTPLEVCLERNEKREGRARVPDDAIIKMSECFFFPTKNEGFDMIEVIENE